MVVTTLKRLTAGPRPVAAVLLLLLASLYLMSAATQNSAQFSRVYSLLLAINGAALLLLVTLIVRNLVSLLGQYRRRAPGARLTLRLVVMFVMLAVAPVSVVYYFSVQFLQRGIDSWFDVRVERALEDALELGRTALDSRLSESLQLTRQLAIEFIGAPESVAALKLDEVRQQGKALEMTLLTGQGRVLASSSADPTDIVPSMPNLAVLLQLRQGMDYAALEPTAGGLQVRVVVPVTEGLSSEPKLLLAIYPINERLSSLGESVQAAFGQYKELAYLRQPLKFSFTLTLSLVLLLSILSAVWAAFFSARRLVAPIRDLAEGTRAVAAGDYDLRLPLPGRDEIGFLVRSFNEMTRKIALSHERANRSQRQVEAQRAYLETVLAHLSSGVLTVAADGSIRTSNRAAAQILGLEPSAFDGASLSDLAVAHVRLATLIDTLGRFLGREEGEWHAEVTLFGPAGRQILSCHGSPLPDGGDMRGGQVIVFDDVTALIQAQRDAAWGEVARRLAHEIKNPLTPIQLSAERLRRKYLDRMSPEDAEVLNRATHTIVQQVEAMKEMVKAFSEYAHTPAIRLAPMDLNMLVTEVAELYRGDKRMHINLALAPRLHYVEADAMRMRQLLHNLLKNALEAAPAERTVEVRVSTTYSDAGCEHVELLVEDDGPGIAEALLGRLFEPYVTSKPRGTGLGLAIVKKIVEEHGGMLSAQNRPAGGAAISVRLPIGSQDCAARLARQSQDRRA
ncbi:MAG: ATP-binding protein [Gammaproteobacteria bacterium]|nr:ATP-binding protein [Gammaproteobacteria bacterium]